MTGVIKSGKSGNTAIVDTMGRLSTLAITESREVTLARQGDSYSVIHQIIELTSDSESFVMYIKNTDTVSWILGGISTDFSDSENGDGRSFRSRIVANPAGGTLLTTGTDGAATTLNIGSPKELDIIVKS